MGGYRDNSALRGTLQFCGNNGEKFLVLRLEGLPLGQSHNPLNKIFTMQKPNCVKYQRFDLKDFIFPPKRLADTRFGLER